MEKLKTGELVRSISGLFGIALGTVYLTVNPQSWPFWAIRMGWAIIAIGTLLLISGKFWEWPVFHRKPRCVQDQPATPKVAKSTPLDWYTLDVYHGWAVNLLEDKQENRDRCRTLAARLQAESAKAGLTRWGDERQKVGTAVRSWLVSQHSMTAQDAGRTPVSAIIGLLTEAATAKAR